MSISTSVDIAASPEKVWEVFSDFEGLKQWQSWLTVHAPKNAAAAPVGSKLDITLLPAGGSPFSIKPEVLTNTPASELRWRGKLGGSNFLFVGEHFFQLKPTPTGTHFLHGETFKGCLVPLLSGVISKSAVEFEKFNQTLKQRVEGSKQ